MLTNLNSPSKNIQANAHRKKKWRSPATMPHTTGLSVWLMPAKNSTSATNRHTQRFLWIVVRSDCKFIEKTCYISDISINLRILQWNFIK